MEGYHRDSLRELRRMAEQRPEPKKGSRFITLLIVLLFLAAGGFYLKTAEPDWFRGYFESVAVSEKLAEWKEEALSVFRQEEGDVTETVDGALAEQEQKA